MENNFTELFWKKKKEFNEFFEKQELENQMTLREKRRKQANFQFKQSAMQM